MNKIGNWMVGLTIVSLLAVGLVALAGNGFGENGGSWNAQAATSGECDGHERDADGDGIVNSDDPDWAEPQDGSGYGQGGGYGRNLSADRPLDGTGYGARQGGGHGAGQRSGQGRRGGSGDCDGGCV